MTQGAPTPSRLLSGLRFYARVLRYFMKVWPFVLLTIFFIVLATLCAVLQPFPVAILIDSLYGKEANTHWAYRLVRWMTPDPSGGMVRQIVALAVMTFLLRVLQEL